MFLPSQPSFHKPLHSGLNHLKGESDFVPAWLHTSLLINWNSPLSWLYNTSSRIFLGDPLSLTCLPSEEVVPSTFEVFGLGHGYNKKTRYHVSRWGHIHSTESCSLGAFLGLYSSESLSQRAVRASVLKTSGWLPVGSLHTWMALNYQIIRLFESFKIVLDLINSILIIQRVISGWGWSSWRHGKIIIWCYSALWSIEATLVEKLPPHCLTMIRL